MEFKHLKQDFPKMPEEIKTMIENEVKKQLKTEPQTHRSKKTVRKTLALSLAAVMLCGLTVFAGAGLYRMQRQQTGEHGVSVRIESSEGTGEASFTIPDVKLEVGYLPDGMVRTEHGKYSFEDHLALGGISMVFYRMDTGNDQFELRHEDVVLSEEFSAGGYQGIYLEYPHLSEEEVSFNQRIYVAYTDVHYVMEMYAASDVSREEALKIAEHVKLIPTEDKTDQELVTAQNWSDYQNIPEQSDTQTGEEYQTITSVASEKMQNTHVTGDRFQTSTPGLSVKVSDVQIADDLSLLDASLIDEDLKKEVDENGKLRPATIQYIKKGDSDSLSQETASRKAPQKLVYTTVEYANTGTETLTDVLFFGSLMRITEVGGQMQIVQDERPADGDAWDMAVNHGLSGFHDMLYYDVRGGERNNNYIACMQPGEIVTVHMAWVVMEEELDTLYLNLDPSGGSYEFTDSSLQIGYVDIRR